MKTESFSMPTKTSLEIGRTILNFPGKGDLSFPKELLTLFQYLRVQDG